jgi:phosphoribosylglycinamide formyltransferase-1
MFKIAILASGSGSNAENLIRYFSNHRLTRIQLILTNNANAGVIDRAKNLNVACKVLSKKDFSDETISDILREEKIDFIVLAGFLLLIPSTVINIYKNKIINIHPALLPLHGGKGFYGMKVHDSVIQSQSILSGITIHYVNEHFDQGEIIFQAACHVSKNETSESLAEKIHKLEYRYFPVVVEKVLSTLNK